MPGIGGGNLTQARDTFGCTQEEVKPRQIFWKLKMLSAMIACTLAALALISFSVSVVNTVRQVEQAEAELQALLEESRQLQLQIASLRTPGRLEEEAYKRHAVPRKGADNYLDGKSGKRIICIIANRIRFCFRRVSFEQANSI